MFDVATLHPPYAEQVGDADEGAVAEAVFCGAGKTLRVLYRRFVDGIAAHLYQGRKVPVRAAEQLDALDHVRAIDLQAAGRVVHGFLGDPVSDAVGLARLPAP